MPRSVIMLVLNVTICKNVLRRYIINIIRTEIVNFNIFRGPREINPPKK